MNDARCYLAIIYRKGTAFYSELRWAVWLRSLRNRRALAPAPMCIAILESLDWQVALDQLAEGLLIEGEVAAEGGDEGGSAAGEHWCIAHWNKISLNS